jgi:hypothetical protein
MSAEEKSKGKAALAAAARAFTRAQTKGYVWISDEGTFETWEQTGLWAPAPPAPSINPGQLRLAD